MSDQRHQALWLHEQWFYHSIIYPTMFFAVSYRKIDASHVGRTLSTITVMEAACFNLQCSLNFDILVKSLGFFGRIVFGDNPDRSRFGHDASLPQNFDDRLVVTQSSPKRVKTTSVLPGYQGSI